MNPSFYQVLQQRRYLSVEPRGRVVLFPTVWAPSSCTTHPHASPLPSRLPASTGGGDGAVQRRRIGVRERGRRRQGEVRSRQRRLLSALYYRCVNVSFGSNDVQVSLNSKERAAFLSKVDIFSLIPSACFISGLFVWWAWSTKHARDPWDRKLLQRERSPRSRIYSMLPNQTLRGTPKALMHVTVLTAQTVFIGS